MPKQALKCTKCSRVFSMPAHLARHMSAIHSSPAKRAASKKHAAASATVARKRPKRTAKKIARWKAGASALGQTHTGVAARLVGDMQSYLGELNRQQVVLDAEVTAITGALAAMGTRKLSMTTAAPRRGRPPGTGTRPTSAKKPGFRAGSLKSYIVRVLSQRSRPMSPRDITVAVSKLGYKSKAKDLTKAVSNSLPELKNIKKVGFGMYKL